MDPKTYIAELSSSDLNEEVQKYFEEQGIKMIKYLKSLNMVVIESRKDLLSEEIKYLKNMEEDKTFIKQKKADL